MLEGWLQKREEKDQKRAENRKRWAERRDWSSYDRRDILFPDPQPAPGESRSLAKLRAIMANPEVAPFRRLDAAELVLQYELGPGAAVGLDPDRIAAQSYQFLNALADEPSCPDALRFRALRCIASVENARAAAKSSALVNTAKRQILLDIVNAERQRSLRLNGQWLNAVSDGSQWQTKIADDCWPSDWPGQWKWPPDVLASALQDNQRVDVFIAQLRGL